MPPGIRKSPDLSVLIGSKGSPSKREAEAGQSLRAQTLELQRAKSEPPFSHFLAVRPEAGHPTHRVIVRFNETMHETISTEPAQ